MGSCMSRAPEGGVAALEPGSLKLASPPPGAPWQDRQIRWDQPRKALLPPPGEVVLSEFSEVEDTKGENGLGSLTVTNLRLIWRSAERPEKLNISIGLHTVAYVHFNAVDSRLFGRIRAAHLMAQLHGPKFEFSFAVAPERNMAVFTALDSAARRYRATRYFRDLVLKDARLLQHGSTTEIYIFYGETVLRRVAECDNVTASEKFAGRMVITDCRFAWVSNRCHTINVSVPYVQVRNLSVRSSCFGASLVVETSHSSGGYVLGFNFASPRELREVQALVQGRVAAARAAPSYGPADGVVVYVDDRQVVVADANEVFDTAGSAATPESADRAAGAAHSRGVEVRGAPEGGARGDGGGDLVAGLAAAAGGAGSGAGSGADGDAATGEGPAAPAGPGAASGGAAVGGAASGGAAGGSCRRPRVSSGSTTASPTNFPGGADAPAAAEEDDRLTPLPGTPEPAAAQGPGPLVVARALSNDKSLRSVAAHAAKPPTAGLAAAAELIAFLSPSSRKYRAPKCVICMANIVDTAFDPCGHLSCCTLCAPKVTQCPICRTNIEKALRIYVQAT